MIPSFNSRGKAEPIRVVVVDDHHMVVESIKELLSSNSTIEVVGTADTPEAALEVISTERPNVALVDIRLRESNGIELTRTIRQLHPELQVIVLTGFNYSQYVIATAKAGAKGYLLKETCSAPELMSAICAVNQGNTVVSKQVGQQLFDLLGSSTGSADWRSRRDLTMRELEVQELLEAGLPKQDIAHRLKISPKTLNTHVGHIKTKVGVGAGHIDLREVNQRLLTV